MRLEDLGWDPTLGYHADEVGAPNLLAGRLATVDRGQAQVLTEWGTLRVVWRFPVPMHGESEGSGKPL